MRLWKCQCLLLGALLVNILVLYYFWKLQTSLEKVEGDAGVIEPHGVNGGSDVFRSIPSTTLNVPKHNDSINAYISLLANSVKDPNALNRIVTVVIREFEFFENDLSETVQSFLRVVPSINVVILADAYPYPPLQLPSSVHVIVLHPHIDEPSFVSQPEHYISTPFALLVPDSVRLTSPSLILDMLTYFISRHKSSDQQLLVAAKVTGEKSRCIALQLRLQEWTLVVKEVEERKALQNRHCDAVFGTSVILASTKNLFNLAQPFLRPFPYALFIQTAVQHWKVHVMEKTVFHQGKPLFLENHVKWKHSMAEKERIKMLYDDFGIKKVVQPVKEVEWFGCTRSTPRCFGTVVNDMPEYLFAKRWTPPCCLLGLEETARHVFKTLKTSGVRYWLEGGSLLGAARNGQIIPWDYDVDVGVYEEDLSKCFPLQELLSGQLTVVQDEFVWEKAPEGDFFRVQYSQINRLHVDIFPFIAKDGVMTKRTWIKSHPQDTEFPEHYLRPLTTVRFLGVDASAPNNIREFLEYKFGKGVIENPQYPNPQLMDFPNVTLTN